VWSKKIWIDKPKFTINNINVCTKEESKQISFADQDAYEAWLRREERIAIGWLIISNHNKDATKQGAASFKLVVGHQPSLEALAYSYDGKPKYILCLDITPDYKREYPCSYESEAVFRAFTEEEMNWAENNVVIQNHVKDCIAFFKSQFN
jgi:hypothetical protein